MTSLWRASKGEGGREKRERGYEKEGKLSIFAPARQAIYDHHTFLVS